MKKCIYTNKNITSNNENAHITSGVVVVVYTTRTVCNCRTTLNVNHMLTE